MIKNGHKTIGVHIAEIFGEYPGALCFGISSEAKKLGYNVVFFTNYNGYGKRAYDNGEIFISDLPDYSALDGLILSTDTIHVNGLEERITENIKTISCPVVSIRHSFENCYNVLVNDNYILEDIITHFIEVHHFKHLAFLAGPKGFPDSEARLNCFYRIMNEHGLKVDDSDIFYGDFWKAKGYEAVDYFCAEGKEWPQAIVCANDYMAITVCNALIDRGIRVPEDIAVSGNDDVASATYYSPSLTTAGMPISNMGETAVDVLDALFHGKKVDKNTYLNSYTVYRESCGCQSCTTDRNSVSRTLMNRFDKLRTTYQHNSSMSNVLTAMNTLEDICNHLGYYVYAIEGFKNFYMCLCSDWLKLNRPSGFSDNVFLAFHENYNGQSFSSTPTFPRHELLPSEVLSGEPVVYYVNVLHYHEKIFGYVILEFIENNTYSSSYEGWLINVGNALENICTATEMNRLVGELARTYSVDLLTGLYNRRGLEVLSKELLSSPHTEKEQLMIFCADMDDLKAVNDNYGHASGDIAIKAISEALQEAAVDNYICARCGGDEFTVIGILRSDSTPLQYAQRFNERIDLFNKADERPWLLRVSYGWVVLPISTIEDIEEGMKQADGHLYKEKAMNKARRLIETLER